MTSERVLFESKFSVKFQRLKIFYCFGPEGSSIGCCSDLKTRLFLFASIQLSLLFLHILTCFLLIWSNLTRVSGDCTLERIGWRGFMLFVP